MVLFTLLNPLLLGISKMRELDQISFLRETSPSRPLHIAYCTFCSVLCTAMELQYRVQEGVSS